VSVKIAIPEQRFVQAVFPHELSRECLEAPFAPHATAILVQLRRQIASALSNLSYRARGILEMRYGLGDGYSYSLAEIGFVFRLSRERIRQLQVKALKHLRRQADDLRNFIYDLDS
jgi:RNA polymerase sigma factor (sigma-70 family)